MHEEMTAWPKEYGSLNSTEGIRKALHEALHEDPPFVKCAAIEEQNLVFSRS